MQSIDLPKCLSYLFCGTPFSETGLQDNVSRLKYCEMDLQPDFNEIDIPQIGISHCTEPLSKLN